MALPKLNVPTYDLTLPSTGESLTYRPFLVKEEKILLMATEGDDEQAMTRALRQIVTNCVLTEIDIDKLKTYDLEYVFLQLRSKSIGEVSDLRYTCQNNIAKGKKTEKICGETISIKLDLSAIEVQKPEGHEPNVPLINNVGLVLKDPEVSILTTRSITSLNETSEMFDVIADCVDYVYDGEQLFKDFKREEIEEFLGSITQKQFEGIKTFFDTLPKLEHQIELNCSKCKNNTMVMLRGLTDFFM